jgi:predicted transcriptional regulator
MLTDREQKVVNWLQKRKVATMRQLRYQFQLSHMTVNRALKKYGYYTSYNYNGGYYVLHDVPDFSEGGLWTYRDIRFSKYGTLTKTLVALVNESPAGLTVVELEERLETKVANLVSRLVGAGVIQREKLSGGQAVYLARDAELSIQQHQQRQELIPPAAAGTTADLPPGCSPMDVIEVLRQIILARDPSNPEQLARQLKARGVRIGAGQIRGVIDYYMLKKKRRSSR